MMLKHYVFFKFSTINSFHWFHYMQVLFPPGLVFKPGASCLLRGQSTTWTMPLALFVFALGWPWTWSSDPWPPVAGMTGIHHHTWLYWLRWTLPNVLPGLASKLRSSQSASQVAGIIGMSHHIQPCIRVFIYLAFPCEHQDFLFFTFILRTISTFQMVDSGIPGS
jgi:hypothetical protein